MDDYKKAYDEWEQKWMRECKQKLDKDPKFPLTVTPEQAIIILEPSEAPENFYCDGEISHAQALANWKRKLKESGLNPTHVAMITKYVFG